MDQLPAFLTTVEVASALGAVVLALLVGLVATLLRRRRRSRSAQARRLDDPGEPLPEYWLHPLRPEVCRQLRDRWTALQRDFVDAPQDTLRRADALVAEAMRERGYPAVDAPGRTRLLDEHEPAHVERYRELRRALEDDHADETTEHRRQVLLQARTLFDALLRDDTREQPTLFAA